MSSLVQAALPEASEEEVCKICAQRLCARSGQVAPEAYDDLLELDDAAQFLDKDDCKELQREGEKAKSQAAVMQEYRAAVLAKRGRISGVGGGGGVGRHRSSRPSGPRRRIPQEGVIPHESAKSLSPPGSYIWRALTEGAWCGRLPPNGERSRSWRRHGEREACLQILRILWAQWADSEGLPLSAVPVDGLFPDTVGEASACCSQAAPSGAASSSTVSAPAALAPAAQKAKGRRVKPPRA